MLLYCTANLESVLDIYFSFTRLEVIRVKAFNCKMDKLSEPSPVPFFYVQNSTISCRAGHATVPLQQRDRCFQATKLLGIALLLRP